MAATLNKSRAPERSWIFCQTWIPVALVAVCFIAHSCLFGMERHEKPMQMGNVVKKDEVEALDYTKNLPVPTVPETQLQCTDPALTPSAPMAANSPSTHSSFAHSSFAHSSATHCSSNSSFAHSPNAHSSDAHCSSADTTCPCHRAPCGQTSSCCNTHGTTRSIEN